MADQCIAGRCCSNSPPVSFQQLCAKRQLHSGNALAYGRESQAHSLGALRKAALLYDGQEQPHIGQIETQRRLSFGIAELSHRKLPIVTFDSLVYASCGRGQTCRFLR
jgi:hypothetical protein